MAIVGVVIAHLSIAQLIPSATTTDCADCRSLDGAGAATFPAPLQELPLNANLMSRISGFTHGDGYGSAAFSPQSFQEQIGIQTLAETKTFEGPLLNTRFWNSSLGFIQQKTMNRAEVFSVGAWPGPFPGAVGWPSAPSYPVFY